MTSQDRSTKTGATSQQPSGALAVEVPWPRLGGLPLHPRLEAVLRRLQAAERAAVGEDRRPAFKLTREVLGASVRLGVPTPVLAACMGTSRASLRNRASRVDGVIPAELVRQLTDLTPRQLDRLSRGELTRGGNLADRPEYPTIDVVRALLSTPRPGGTPVGSGRQIVRVPVGDEAVTSTATTRPSSPRGDREPETMAAAEPQSSQVHETKSLSEISRPNRFSGPSLSAGCGSGISAHDEHGDR